MNNYTAVFIGGEYDMMKRKLDRKIDRVDMPELPRALSFSQEPPKMAQLCNVLSYILVGETPSGVLIYELKGGTE